MCGICGFVGAGDEPVESIVQSMMTAMVHRGPNDSGYEPIALHGGAVGGVGFRRLSILDLSPAGHQPMIHPVTGDCLVFNGEIYNFSVLRSQLGDAGVRFRGTSDTEVLLHALSTWGEEALERLQGMYAFAFHRARDRKLLLARDPLGIKPLYVAALPRGLVFASEVRAVMASGRVDEALDVAGMAGMLAYGSVQAPRTVFAGIRSFPAGHYQWIDHEVVGGNPPASPRRFWSFPARTAPADTDAPGTVRKLLKEAVARHLVADVPVGVFLSAGIDSTVVATLASEISPNVTAFTVGFSASLGEDEVRVASATARSLGVRHVCIELNADTMPTRWQAWLEATDSPSIDGFNTWVVSQSLASEGVIVGLSGLGADEFFGGYATFKRVPRLASLLRMPFVPTIVSAAKATGIARFAGNAAAVEKLSDMVAGERGVAGIALATRRVLSNRRLAALGWSSSSLGLSPDWLEADRERIDPVLDGDDFNTVARTEATHYMRDTLLRDTDANSMRHSLEIRVPFLDLPLVDRVSAFPGRVKRAGRGPGKKLLREACRDILPDAVVNRPKTGFTLPIGDWMAGEMRDACQAAVDHVAGRPQIDGREVRATWAELLANPNSMHWSRPLSLVVLGNFLASTTRRN